MILTTIAISIIIIYLFLIGWFSYGFDKVDAFTLNDLSSKTKFSIVIPFRNEAKNLPKLLLSISKLNYSESLFELIFVDDDSSDDSVSIIEEFLKKRKQFQTAIIKNSRISNSPKKDAITTAIDFSKSEWIITTDADCTLPKYWLDTFDEFIQTNDANFISGPVTYNNNISFFNRFQALDFLSLQGIGIGAFGIKLPFLCNGANLAYRKSIFKTVKGFDGNSNIASGDDIFLLEKVLRQDSKKTHYLKSQKAIVTTQPVENLSGLIQQRIRWASKSSAYNNWFPKVISLIVLLTNSLCVFLIPLVLLGALNIRIAVALFVIKFSIDFLLLFKTVRLFKQESLLTYYLFSSIIYPFFSTYTATLSLFKPYQWKGRRFKK